MFTDGSVAVGSVAVGSVVVMFTDGSVAVGSVAVGSVVVMFTDGSVLIAGGTGTASVTALTDSLVALEAALDIVSVTPPIVALVAFEAALDIVSATSPIEVFAAEDTALLTSPIVAFAALEAAPVIVVFNALMVALVVFIIAVVAFERFDIGCAMAKVVEPSAITETIVAINKHIFPFIGLFNYKLPFNGFGFILYIPASILRDDYFNEACMSEILFHIATLFHLIFWYYKLRSIGSLSSLFSKGL